MCVYMYIYLFLQIFTYFRNVLNHYVSIAQRNMHINLIKLQIILLSLEDRACTVQAIIITTVFYCIIIID